LEQNQSSGRDFKFVWSKTSCREGIPSLFWSKISRREGIPSLFWAKPVVGKVFQVCFGQNQSSGRYFKFVLGKIGRREGIPSLFWAKSVV
jgi:lipid-A-disaccharide synthase-like uncharacterized protein